LFCGSASAIVAVFPWCVVIGYEAEKQHLAAVLGVASSRMVKAEVDCIKCGKT
jgi:hypothetical protein